MKQRIRVHGLHFRRQHPVGRFVLDFYCARYRLCIEVDGGYHDDPDQQERDAARTAALNIAGYRVLRFTNDEVTTNLDPVLETVEAALSLPAGETPQTGE